MRRIILVVLAIVLLIALVACAAPVSEPEKIEGPTTEPIAAPEPPAPPQPQETVAFTDPTLEAMVRATMGKPDGDITLEEARAVTGLNLSYAEWRKCISDNEAIGSIAGLENFTSLESLDLSGNKITDIAPLSALTNLKALILTDCAAEDYSPLAALTNLRVLILDNSTISDPAPLLGLSNLNCLYIKDSEIRNYFPLADIRAKLDLADFYVATTLSDLGFVYDDHEKLALYQTDKYDIRINRREWGEPPRSGWGDCIVVVTGTETGYKNAIGFYPVHNTYVAWLFNANTEKMYTYVYNLDEANYFSESTGLDEIIREAFVDVNEEDVLRTPFIFFDNMIQCALGIPLEVLANMPFEPISLASLGFVESEEVRGYLYVHNEQDGYFDVSIHDPKQPAWDCGGELCFFIPLSDEYRVAVLYHVDDKRFTVKADDNYGGGAEYEVLFESGECIDIMCSDDSLTVEQYFEKAINDPEITDPYDVYHYVIKRMVSAVESEFGMGLDELCALPVK